MIESDVWRERFVETHKSKSKMILIALSIISWNLFEWILTNNLFAIIYSVATRSLVYIKDIFFCMVVFILLYASIGLILFGGTITQNTIEDLKKFKDMPSEEIDLIYNFNDYYSAVFTLINIIFSGFAEIMKINDRFGDEEIDVYFVIFIVSYNIINILSLF